MRPERIIFDCDGVLIDSEGIAAVIIAENLTALGWPMDTAHAQRAFLGMSIADMQPMIEARLGHSLALDWREVLGNALLVALGEQARPVHGARAMLERVNTLGIPWCVASNSSPAEMEVKFARTGLASLTQGRVFSAASVIARGGRAKPAPDLFLWAAADVSPNHCLVLEDSPLGVRGAVAAGMVCYGFAPHGGAAALLAAGARGILRDLPELFGVLR